MPVSHSCTPSLVCGSSVAHIIRAEEQEEPAPVLPRSLLHQTVLTRDGGEPPKSQTKLLTHKLVANT